MPRAPATWPRHLGSLLDPRREPELAGSAEQPEAQAFSSARGPSSGVSAPRPARKLPMGLSDGTCSQNDRIVTSRGTASSIPITDQSHAQSATDRKMTTERLSAPACSLQSRGAIGIAQPALPGPWPPSAPPWCAVSSPPAPARPRVPWYPPSGRWRRDVRRDESDDAVAERQQEPDGARGHPSSAGAPKPGGRAGTCAT